MDTYGNQLELMEVNGKTMERYKADLLITKLNEKGKNADVTYPDGARWMFRGDGRSYKLNDM